MGERRSAVVGDRAACAVLAAVWLLGGCDKSPALIGYAYGRLAPNVIDVAREAMARQPGRRIQIQIVEDPRQAGPARDVEFATRLTAEAGMAGVVGHQDSRGSLLAAPVYDEARIPLLIPNATSRRLRNVSPWVFMLVPDDSAEGAFIADFAVDRLAARSVAVLYDNDEYGRGLRDGVRAALGARGLTIAGEAPIGAVCTPSPLGGDASIALVVPRRAAPQVLVIAGRTPDAACIARRVTALSPGIRLIAGDGVEVDSGFIANAGAAADSFYVVAFWHRDLPTTESAAFMGAFTRLVHRPPLASDALQFDALMLLAQAIREAGTNPRAVRAYLLGLGTARPAYAGVTGPISFTPDRQRPLYMLRLLHGALRPATAP